VASKKSYNRYFIIFQEEDKGFGMALDKQPTGYTKIETRNGKCKITVYAQNLVKEKGPYTCYLIDATKNPVVPAKLGELKIDDTGRGETWWEFKEDDVANTGVPVDRFNVAAVVVEGNKINAPLAGYVGKDKIVWKDKMASMPRTTELKEDPKLKSEKASEEIKEETRKEEPEEELDDEARKFKEYEENIKKEAAKEEASDNKDSLQEVRNASSKNAEDPKTEELNRNENKEGKPTAANTDGPKVENKEENRDNKPGQTNIAQPKEEKKENKPAQTNIAEPKEEKKENKPEQTNTARPKEEKKENKSVQTNPAQPKAEKKENNPTQTNTARPKEEKKDNKPAQTNPAQPKEEKKSNNPTQTNTSQSKSENKNNNEGIKAALPQQQEPNREVEPDGYTIADDESFTRRNKSKDKKYANMFHNVLNSFEEVDGLSDELKGYRWWKVPHAYDVPIRDNKYYPYYSAVYHLKMTYPYINYIKCFKKTGHYYFGLKYDDEGEVKYIVYGIEGRNNIQEQPYMGMTGFLKWVPIKDKDTGMWLMYYNPYTGCIMIPKRRG
jgi:hypothetical protein